MGGLPSKGYQVRICQRYIISTVFAHMMQVVRGVYRKPEGEEAKGHGYGMDLQELFDIWPKGVQGPVGKWTCVLFGVAVWSETT